MTDNSYSLRKANSSDLEKLMDAKFKVIYEYAKNLSSSEKNDIDKYVKDNIPKMLDYYFVIELNDKQIGCVLYYPEDDGVLLDEIFIDQEYRNRKIGSNIIKDIITNNSITYLWVYKDNVNAIKLYEGLGFKIIKETESRFYMRCKS